MKEYRIVKKTDARGYNWYYPQYRFLYFFWIYFRGYTDMSGYKHKVGHISYECALDEILSRIKNYEEKQSYKIVKTEILDI